MNAKDIEQLEIKLKCAAVEAMNQDYDAALALLEEAERFCVVCGDSNAAAHVRQSKEEYRRKIGRV